MAGRCVRRYNERVMTAAALLHRRTLLGPAGNLGPAGSRP
jgi:hypothetical protein